MGSNASALVGTPASLSLLQPFFAPAHPSHTGIFLGIDLRTGQSLFFDPWELKKTRKIHSTTALFTGQKDMGKSALMKSLILRLMSLQAGSEAISGDDGNTVNTPIAMRGRVSDRKLIDGSGEYTPPTEYLEGDTISLAEIGGINIFDLEMEMSELDMYEAAVIACEIAASRSLVGFEPLMLQVGINLMLKGSPIPHITVLQRTILGLTWQDVSDYFNHVDMPALDQLIKMAEGTNEHIEWLKMTFKRPINISPAEVESAASMVSALLGLVVRGDFGTLFNGYQSLRSKLSSGMVNLDWNNVPDKAVSLLESLIHLWHEIGLRHKELNVIPHLNASDEEHTAILNSTALRYKLAEAKRSRSVHTFTMDSTQSETKDFAPAGDAGKALREAYGMRFIAGHPNNDESRHDLMQIGLSEMDAIQVASWEIEIPGRFCLLLPGKPAVFYQHILTPIELSLSGTNKVADDMYDKRLGNLLPVMTPAEIVDYTKTHGAAQIGADA